MQDLEQRTDRSGLRSWLKIGLGAVLALGAYQAYEFTQPAAPPIVYDAGRIVAAAELDYVLDNPAMGGGASGITAGRQFANASGQKCRTFAQGYISGSACFKDGQWRLVEMTQRPAPSGD